VDLIMLLKVTIVILFIGVIASLFGGLNFLVKDMGNASKRLLYALGIRIGLASLLIACVIYGTYSGQLNSTAPWDRQLHPENATPFKPTPKN
jgi:uncharacterized membrane protein